MQVPCCHAAIAAWWCNHVVPGRGLGVVEGSACCSSLGGGRHRAPVRILAGCPDTDTNTLLAWACRVSRRRAQGGHMRR